jgi:hypothetical protein
MINMSGIYAGGSVESGRGDKMEEGLVESDIWAGQMKIHPSFSQSEQN